MKNPTNIIQNTYGITKGILQNILVIVLMQTNTMVAFLVFVALIIIHTSVLKRGMKSHNGALGFMIGFSITIILFMDKFALYLGY